MFTIGKRSAGIIIIVIGLLFAVHQWTSIESLQLFQYLWIAAIGLILFESWSIYQKSMAEDEKPSFHKPSVALLVVITIGSLLFSQIVTNNIAVGIPFMNSLKTSAEWTEEIAVTDDMNAFHLDIPNAKVAFGIQEGDSIVIEGVIRGNQTTSDEVIEAYKEQLTISEVADVLEYTIEHESMISFFGSSNQLELEATILLPEYLKVDARVINGELESGGLVQEIYLQTTNGNIAVGGHQSSVETHSTNGRLDLVDIEGELDARTTNGNIHIINPEKSGEAKTTNGSISVDWSNIQGDWDLTGTNGKINLHIPDHADATIEGRTTNGSVSGPLEWTREYEESSARQDRQGSAELGEGTHRIHARTVNGSIQVDLN
ncbi:DUF4097 family beta strand repeat-containing protein [Salisediminibacterium beveridgei]|uniref:DUF4097 domain-containing protein n=1 Tax=Salisediminibacterium beveridgei TaxID=632773 RepID=A0A1D7QUM5_9BACI|nr:DUF4097 family beta strand repeat-containing protein [Salisediminibacterium beveridgei]AOM82658.1 hypothetical protein BBEV_1293 [Salisediminibacterium beveridgei]